MLPTTRSGLDSDPIPDTRASNPEEILAPKTTISKRPIFDALKSVDFFNIPLEPFTPPEIESPGPSQPGSPASERPCLPDHDSSPSTDISHSDEEEHAQHEQVDNNLGVEGNRSGFFPNGPQYSDVSDVFTEEEYLNITTTYKITGVDCWKDLAADPIIRARRALAAIARQDRRTQSQGTDEYPGQKDAQDVRIPATMKHQMLGSYLENMPVRRGNCQTRNHEETEPYYAPEIPVPGIIFPQRSTQKLSHHSSLDNDDFLAKLNQKARESKRSKSPTSSSSSYGSKTSFRSRSSMSSDAREFPYAYPSTRSERRPFLDSDEYINIRGLFASIKKRSSFLAKKPTSTLGSPLGEVTVDHNSPSSLSPSPQSLRPPRSRYPHPPQTLECVREIEFPAQMPGNSNSQSF